jgi:hypothetical protein
VRLSVKHMNRRYRHVVEPVLPDQPHRASADDGWEVGDVGAFRQGSALSRWALARYLVGRALGESISRALLILAALILGLAAVIGWGLGSTFWAVVVSLVALAVLAMRAVLRAVLRRLTAVEQADALAARLRALVSDTRADVLRELRRIGLPGRTWTLPLLALRFLGRKRRRDAVARRRTFDLDRVAPPGRVDELHLVLRAHGSAQPPY